MLGPEPMGVPISSRARDSRGNHLSSSKGTWQQRFPQVPVVGVPHSRVVRVPEFSKPGRSFPRIPSPAPFPGALEAQSYFVSMGEGVVSSAPSPAQSERGHKPPALERFWHSAGLRPDLSGQSGTTFSCALLPCLPPPVSMETLRVSIPGLGASVRCCGAAAIVCVDGVIWSSPYPSEAP